MRSNSSERITFPEIERAGPQDSRIERERFPVPVEGRRLGAQETSASHINEIVSPIVGISAPIVSLRDEIARVSQSDVKVLITGESGSGKELVAAELHALSPRAQRPFLPINCAGLPEELLESELFGHMRGSFTGAYRDKPGRFELADGGSVFLDEIGEMTPRMQGLLLRFLQTGELQKVGGEHATIHVDVRVIAATNRDLRELVRRGQFRDDLFYRINVVALHAPPLRERKEDIPLLADLFFDRFRRRHPSHVQSLGPDIVPALMAYEWPGNVRELENVIERLVVTGRHEVAMLVDLPREIVNGPPPAGTAEAPERRRTVVDDLFARLTERHESFWTAVYPLYVQREITRANVRELVRRGLAASRGNYKLLARMFNLPPDDYKRFLRFLRKHGCQVPFMEYRR